MNDLSGIASIQEEKLDEVLILRIKGRLDAVTSGYIEKKIFDAINSGKLKLLLNFSGVTYISSAGLRMLLSTTKKIRSLPGKIIICCINSNVIDVFRMSGFDHILELSESEEEAMRLL